MQIVVISFVPSNCFLNGFPIPSQFAAAKLTYYSTMPQRPLHQNPGPGPASKYLCVISIYLYIIIFSNFWGELYMQSLFWLGSFEVFWSLNKTQQSTDKLRTRHAKSFHHLLQLKYLMEINSPFCNSTQMVSAKNRLNMANS